MTIQLVQCVSLHPFDLEFAIIWISLLHFFFLNFRQLVEAWSDVFFNLLLRRLMIRLMMWLKVVLIEILTLKQIYLCPSCRCFAFRALLVLGAKLHKRYIFWKYRPKQWFKEFCLDQFHPSLYLLEIYYQVFSSNFLFVKLIPLPFSTMAEKSQPFK